VRSGRAGRRRAHRWGASARCGRSRCTRCRRGRCTCGGRSRCCCRGRSRRLARTGTADQGDGQKCGSADCQSQLGRAEPGSVHRIPFIDAGGPANSGRTTRLSRSKLPSSIRIDDRPGAGFCGGLVVSERRVRAAAARFDAALVVPVQGQSREELSADRDQGARTTSPSLVARHLAAQATH
jgi:hypothetical protein